MTIETQIHDYLRDRYTNPLRSNIVKAGHLRNNTDANGTQAGMVLRAMHSGEIEGVELSIYNNPSAGQPRYRIESVADDIQGRVYVDPETCAEIRRTLKSGDYTQKQVADLTGVSPTQVSTHGRGHCSHEVAEPEAESIKLGPHRYRYKEPAEVKG